MPVRSAKRLSLRTLAQPIERSTGATSMVPPRSTPIDHFDAAPSSTGAGSLASAGGRGAEVDASLELNTYVAKVRERLAKVADAGSDSSSMYVDRVLGNRDGVIDDTELAGMKAASDLFHRLGVFAPLRIREGEGRKGNHVTLGKVIHINRDTTPAEEVPGVTYHEGGHVAHEHFERLFLTRFSTREETLRAIRKTEAEADHFAGFAHAHTDYPIEEWLERRAAGPQHDRTHGTPADRIATSLAGFADGLRSAGKEVPGTARVTGGSDDRRAWSWFDERRNVTWVVDAESRVFFAEGKLSAEGTPLTEYELSPPELSSHSTLTEMNETEERRMRPYHPDEWGERGPLALGSERRRLESVLLYVPMHESYEGRSQLEVHVLASVMDYWAGLECKAGLRGRRDSPSAESLLRTAKERGYTEDGPMSVDAMGSLSRDLGYSATLSQGASIEHLRLAVSTGCPPIVEYELPSEALTIGSRTFTLEPHRGLAAVEGFVHHEGAEYVVLRDSMTRSDELNDAGHKLIPVESFGAMWARRGRSQLLLTPRNAPEIIEAYVAKGHRLPLGRGNTPT